MRQQAERELRLQLRLQPLAPPLLVSAKRSLRELIRRERPSQYIRGNRGADDAVVDSAAGRGLDQTGRVPHDQEAVAVGLAYGSQRKDPLARRDGRARVKLPAPSESL